MGPRSCCVSHRRAAQRFDHCILGEPTNPDALGEMIKIGRRGSLNGVLSVRGRQGHVAYPRRASNPIPQLVRLIAALTAAPLDAGTAHFDASNLEFVSVDTGNPAFNVIPAEARARFNIRFNDLWTPETLAAELRKRAKAAADGADFELRFEPCNALAFLTAPDRFTDLSAGGDREAYGASAFAFDERGNLGRALHPSLLSGGRIRPRRGDHAYDRRACVGEGHRAVDRDLFDAARRLFPKPTGEPQFALICSGSMRLSAPSRFRMRW